jgi:hypothetical protein
MFFKSNISYKLIKMNYTLIILCLFATLKVQSQDLQTPCAATGQAQAGNAIISYTVGEMPLVVTFVNSNLQFTQGILQPQLGIILQVNNFMPGEVKMFPNLTQGPVTLEISLFQPGVLTLQVCNAEGKLMQMHRMDHVSFSNRVFDISNYATGVYLFKLRLKTSDGKTKEGLFKVVKTN